MSESLTKLHYEIDDSTTLQIAHLVNRHLKKTLPASQPFICQKFRENLKTLRVAVQSKLAGFSLIGQSGMRALPRMPYRDFSGQLRKGMIAARVNTGIYERYIPIYQYIPQYIPRYIPAAAAVYTTVYTIAAAVYTTVYTIAAIYTSADKFEF